MPCGKGIDLMTKDAHLDVYTGTTKNTAFERMLVEIETFNIVVSKL
jgi:hypothetical protein